MIKRQTDMMINLQTEQSFRDVKKGEPLSFAELLCIAISNPPDGQRGLTFAQQRERSPVLDKLEAIKINEEIQLTHKEWTNVEEWTKDFQWPCTEGVRALAKAMQAEMDSHLPEEPPKEDNKD